MGITRTEIDRLLLGKLPEVLSDEQKRTKIHNLLSRFSRQGAIVNAGSRRKPSWVIAREAAGNK